MGIKIPEKTRKGSLFTLMPEGDQIIKVTKVSAKPSANPTNVSIEAVNSDNIMIKNRWDLNNEAQMNMFWLFYSLGCGLEADEEGYVEPQDMLGKYVNIEVVHRQGKEKTVVDEDTGEVKTLPPLTFANFGYIHGPVGGFKQQNDEPDTIDDTDDEEEDLGFDD